MAANHGRTRMSDPSALRIGVDVGETREVFSRRFELRRHDIASHEWGLCDIPTRVLAELDRTGFSMSGLLNVREDVQPP